MPVTLTLFLLLVGRTMTGSERVDYTQQIKPIMMAHCCACHGALQQKAGLRLDTFKSMLEGGDSGPALVAGNSKASRLIERVTGRNGVRRMPPAGAAAPLSQDEIRLIGAWIDQGAIAPANEKAEADPRDHWAFRPPKTPTPPQRQFEASTLNPVDAFVAKEWQRLGLKAQPPADKRTLLRRVYLDLVGMAPTLEEQRKFLADRTPDAYEKVVDRLLASSQYGERWGRHWMDIWRYSDWWGLGDEVRNSQKHIWHWRDWIIESLNEDKGYDQMLREMLAADELYPSDLAKMRATGFLARQYFKFNRNTWLEETVEHTAKAFLGLTFNCAKCHDHKYDPISQPDYYRFRAFFEPYQIRLDEVPGEIDLEKDAIPRAFDCNLNAPTYRFERGDERRPLTDRPLAPGVPQILQIGDLEITLVSLPLYARAPELRPFVLADQLRAAEQQIEMARAARHSLPDAHGATSEVARAKIELAKQTFALALLRPELLRARFAAGRAALIEPAKVHELARHAAKLERQAAVATQEERLARRELELVSAGSPERKPAEKRRNEARDNLAKARAGLHAASETYTPLLGSLKTLESNVETEESRRKPFPSVSSGRRSALARWLTDRRHPLTARIAVNHIWARHFGKPLVATVFDFGRKGAAPTHPELLDFLAVEFMNSGWSMKHLHRLLVTSYAYRLTSSAAGSAPGNLEKDPENRYYWRLNSKRLEAEALRDSILGLAETLDPRVGGPAVDPGHAETSRRRSLYLFHSHNEQQKFLSLFDGAGVLECYRRTESIVPQQALALSNSRFALEAAARINAHLARQIGAVDDAAFVRAAFETVLAGTPTSGEESSCVQALAEFKKVSGSVERARGNLIWSLLNHNDFITVR
jgi:mono/diheme cytochrome c family protein